MALEALDLDTGKSNKESYVPVVTTDFYLLSLSDRLCLLAAGMGT